MPRGYRRRYRSYRSGRSKYSNETTNILYATPSALAAGTTFPTGTDSQGNSFRGVVIVPATTVYGARKAKNFDVSITTAGTQTPIVAALVYVPQGTTAGDVNMEAFTGDSVVSLYEPNQNVIGQFVIPATFAGNTQTVTRFKTRLARNLDSGDMIVLVFGNATQIPEGAQIVGTVNYAIKY